MSNLLEIIKEIISEEKADRCLRIARQKYDKPSAYRSGAIVRCRKGDIWKDIKETEDPQSGKAAPYGSGLKKIKEVIEEQSIFEDSALEDACAYARMINKGSERFKLKEKQDGQIRKENNREIRRDCNGFYDE